MLQLARYDSGMNRNRTMASQPAGFRCEIRSPSGMACGVIEGDNAIAVPFPYSLILGIPRAQNTTKCNMREVVKDITGFFYSKYCFGRAE